MFSRVTNHLFDNVLPAAGAYHDAEIALSHAFAQGPGTDRYRAQAQETKRRAAEAAIAIDGLADRAAKVMFATPNEIRRQVSALSAVDNHLREGCVDRICALANVYKHDELSDPKHPFRSYDDVLVVGAGSGIDGYGLGKYSGVEVLINQEDGKKRKFLADVPYALAGWFSFLVLQGVAFQAEHFDICNVRIYSRQN